MIPFWFNRARQLVLLPQILLLRWGIRGWRLYIYLTILGAFTFSLVYFLMSMESFPLFYRGMYEYSSFYCFSPGPVHGQEGTLRSSHKQVLKLVQVQAVIRHGDRAPINTNAIPNIPPVSINCMFNETTKDYGHRLTKFKALQGSFSVTGGDHPIINEASVCAGGQLSPYGFLQHIFNGEHLRKSYLSLFSDAYAHKSTLVYATDYDRTVQSASALLYGIFQDNMEITEHSFAINVIQKNENADFMLAKSGMIFDCPSLLKATIESANNPEMMAVNSVAKLQAELYAELFQVHVDLIPRITKVVDVLVTRLCHGQGLPSGVKGPIPKDLVESSFKLSHRHIIAAHTPLHELQTTALLSHIVQNIADFYAGDSSRRFVLYSGHDSTIAPLLLNLGASDKKWPPYASRVIFEIWESQKHDEQATGAKVESLLIRVRNSFVRVLYNGKVITNKVRFCRNIFDDELCPVEDFLNFVSLDNPHKGDYFKRILNLCNS